MRKSTAWLIVGLATIAIGFAAAFYNFSILNLPQKIPYRIAGAVGYTVALATLPLILAAFTRFRRPWIVLGFFASLVLLATWSVSQHRRQATSTPLAYVQSVQQSIYDCTRNGGAPLTCYTDNSPKRCQQQALGLFSGAANDTDVSPQRMWGLCVASCAGSTTAECRRD